jgi:hypothetical protein
MKNKVDHATSKIKFVVSEIDKLLLSSEIGAFTSRDQLQGFKEAFLSTLAQINSGLLPLKSCRNLGISHVIVDQWPMNSYLGEVIIDAENLYKKI